MYLYLAFSVSSQPAFAALEKLMQTFEQRPRFRIDSDQVDRTVFSNGTIINHPHAEILAALGSPGGALGFVVRDPDRAARESAQLLEAARLPAEVMLNAEPGLPIAFVKTSALGNGALVFRKHILKRRWLLKSARTADGKRLTIVRIPMPESEQLKFTLPVDGTNAREYMRHGFQVGDTLFRVPAASYVNYFVSNNVALIPKY